MCITTSSENPWERRHPCLRRSAPYGATRRQGCLRSQGRFSFFQGVAARHEGSSENNHEETKKAKAEQKKDFALFVSSWLIFIRFQTSQRDMKE